LPEPRTSSATKPRAKVGRALWVELEVPRTDSQRARRVLVDDDGTIAAFLDWQASTHTFPIRTLMVAPGIWIGVFDASAERAVRAWLRLRDIPGV
jgi:hypothetical protein